MNRKVSGKNVAIVFTSVALVVVLLFVYFFWDKVFTKGAIEGYGKNPIIVNTNPPGVSPGTALTGKDALDVEKLRKSTVVLKKAPKPSQDTKKKYQFTAGSNNIFFPKYDTRLAIEGPSFSFVNQEESGAKSFSYSLKNAPAATEVVWQVAALPFAGGVAGWDKPNALLTSGKVPATNGNFTVQFKGLPDLEATGANGAKIFPIYQAQKQFFVRAFPIDAGGGVIGEPGAGTTVVYGLTLPAPQTEAVSKLQLWTPYGTRGSYGGEMQDLPRHDPSKNGNTVAFPANQPSQKRLFYFNGLSNAATHCIIQVSTEEFGTSSLYPKTKNLIYEKKYKLPVPTAELPSTQYLPSVLVPFGQFGKKAAEMKADQYVNYYVRGVVLAPAAQSGQYKVIYTDTVIVKYGFTNPINFISTSPYEKYQRVDRTLPKVSIKNYTPVKWSDPTYLSHYYVFAAPKADEVTCSWQNSDTGKILMPYNQFTEPYYESIGIKNATEYEQKEIPKVLPIGAKVFFQPPTPEDKPWYEELYDGIVGFFKDLTSTLLQIYNAIQTTYGKLKTGLVSFVGNLCPIPSFRAEFEAALMGLVDYGLMTLGIPPTLPSFSELTSMSVDYLASIAMTQAGIPANAITDEIKEKVTEGITKELTTAKQNPDVNPVGSAFLKLDPDYCYQPAYVDLEIENQTKYASVPGTVDLNVTFTMDYYSLEGHTGDPSSALFLTSGNKYAYSSAAAIETASQYRDHFINGLNGHTVDYKQGGEAVYQIFDPKVNVKIPMLTPNTTQTVRVYLNPAYKSMAVNYPTSEGESYDDFANVYFYNGNQHHTNFVLSGNFPTAIDFLQTASKQEGQFMLNDPKTKYFFINEGSASASTSANYQRPVITGW